jgi:hypothetical protein
MLSRWGGFRSLGSAALSHRNSQMQNPIMKANIDAEMILLIEAI